MNLSFFKDNFVVKSESMSLAEYLDACKTDASIYATPAERLLKAVGEPIFVDTSKDPRLSRIFSNRIIRTYAPFNNFFGLEDVIDQCISYMRHAAQGLEANKQILYLLGPVWSA